MKRKDMEIKSFPALGMKVVNEAQGVVEHIITVFGVYDQGGDISHPGSFSKTLAERGNKVRVVDAHNYDSVMRAIGKPLEIREIGREDLPAEVLLQYPEATGGVWARTQFLMDTPEGKGAFIRIKEEAIGEWSYGYDALDVEYGKQTLNNGKEVTVRHLKTIRLFEYSPVLWGSNPATTTLSAKDTKPAPEVTENTIRIRVRAPGDFQEDSFRTISISEDQGIQAVIGKLEGETSTTVQSYIFAKDQWTVSEAQAWVREHEEMAEEGEKTAKAVNLTEKLAEIRQAFHSLYNPPNDQWRYWVNTVFDEYIIVCEGDDINGEYYQVAYSEDADGKIVFVPRAEWIEGEYIFTPKSATKAGRVLAARNEARIVGALRTLIEVLEDAGINVPGGEEKPEKEDDDGEKGEHRVPVSLPNSASDNQITFTSNAVWVYDDSEGIYRLDGNDIILKIQPISDGAPASERAAKEKEQQQAQAGPEEQTPPTSREGKQALLKALIDLELEGLRLTEV